MQKMKKTIITALFASLIAGCVSTTPPPIINIPAPSVPKNITLLLPLHGELANQSQAIYNGFLAAYYYDKQQTQHDINIKVVDTGNDIQDAYQKVVSENPDLIIGPLTKAEVTTVSTNLITIPTIALNTLDNYQTKIIPNLYQFGLASQDEAKQVAAKIIANQQPRTIIITPANSWGENISSYFQQEYLKKGGSITTAANYTAQDNIDQVISNALNIVRNRIHDSSHKTSKVKLEITHRTDVDAIFLVAQPAMARQFMPLLKFYAPTLPVYTISAVYNGNPAPALDQDLNGLFFCDMPWVIKDPMSLSLQLQTIRSQIVSSWPDFMNYTKFYALGIDAYFIAASLNKLIANPDITLVGATGILQLDHYNHIYRTLNWAQMQQGEPKEILNFEF